MLGVLTATAAAAVAAPLAGGAAQAAPAKRATPQESARTAPRRTSSDLVYVSTWNGTQIYGATFDSVSGGLTPLGPVGEADADWAVPHPTLPILYVATMLEDGVVQTFAIDPATGLLTRTGEVATGGAGMGGGGVAYVGLDAPSSTLLVSNFEAGLTAALPISRTGELGTAVSVAQDTGSGPNPRQTGPHPHHVALDPTGRFALVPDFGADRVFVHGFDRETRTFSPGPAPYATAPGSGPRRVAFHPDGRTVYLLSELTADIRTLGWDGRNGSLTDRQTLPIVTDGFTGTKSASDLAVSGDGRFVYVGDRAENSLVVLAADPRTDLLTVVQRVPCGGVTPWGFSVHPGGRWLLVANEASSTVNVFAIDGRSGLLTDTGTSLAVPNPDAITFVSL
jgi:6-phosphogluconolactonase